MDIRGIEVTNQLRSAIRAKLLELGVRYDEELPDYILVMVVNKKTRQQMHEDLHLFLENSTSPFVDWLHDQVLKKLQKVTVAKKKSSREFIPAVVVKQEEERKKRKNAAEEAIQASEKVVTKVEKSRSSPSGDKPERSEKNSKTDVPASREEPRQETRQKSAEPARSEEPKRIARSEEKRPSPIRVESAERSAEKEKTAERSVEKEKAAEKSAEKAPEKSSGRAQKRTSSQSESCERPEKRTKEGEAEAKPAEPEREKNQEETEERSRKLKSYVNKPKITSVISIKTRLGSPRKKFEAKNRFEAKRSLTEFPHSNFPRTEDRLDFSRSRGPRARPGAKIPEARPRRFFDEKKYPKVGTKGTTSVKDRLGTTRSVIPSKKARSNDIAMKNERNAVKSRLGPIKSRLGKNLDRKEFSGVAEDEEDVGEAFKDEEEDLPVGPVRSRIIAVGKPEMEKRQNRKEDKREETGSETLEDELEAGKTLASKVIVTPRPLKPLQPVQKRATQSLLLRAVAEANRSVVRQKNPEPVLTENKPKLKRSRLSSGNREIGKNLSVHLNATKRLVMEKIQVQLSTIDNEDKVETNRYASSPVNDDHMGVVMSLFQRSDDNQKFLVTLNGYNNNVIKDKSVTDEEEDEEDQLEMEAVDDEEIMTTSHQINDSIDQSNSPISSSRIIEGEENDEKIIIVDENNENENIVNVELKDESPERKRRKLSPIVYTRSTSNSPVPVPKIMNKEILEKRTEVLQSNKSRDKCRYWPNCTLGAKCAFFHPEVPCSAFPACKFGEKCAYKHPKCKFGLACTKLGCAFSHPKQQCKYHPFCTKPACPYSHPRTVTPVETTRAKFTWKRRD